MSRLNTLVLALFFTLLTSGCVYKLDISQGNEIDPETVEQLEIGMSRSQVEFLMGTPALIDSLQPNQWHYISYFKNGEDGSVQSSTLTLVFEGDILSRIEGELIPPQ